MLKNNLKANRFFINTVMQYLMTFAQYIFPLITFPYLTRVLEPDVYGMITFLTATVAYFQLLIDYGFNLSATREIAENQHDHGSIGRVVGTVMQAKGLLLGFSVILYAVLIQVIPILQKNAVMAWLYLATVALSILLPDYLFRGMERMHVITIRFIISRSITTLLTFVVVKSRADVAWIPILNALGSLVAIVMTWYEIRKGLKIRVTFGPLAEAIHRLKVSSTYFMATFATTAYGATNSFLIGTMNLPAGDLAYWGVAYNLISAAQSLYSPIVNSLYPHMAAKKDYRLVKKLLMVFMPLILITIIPCFLFADSFIYLVSGSQYGGAIPIFRALLPVLVFSFPAMVIGFPVLGVMGKVKETTMTTTITSVFHICGLALLILVGRFTILNVAILRSTTELVLLGSRAWLLYAVSQQLRAKTIETGKLF